MTPPDASKWLEEHDAALREIYRQSLEEAQTEIGILHSEQQKLSADNAKLREALKWALLWMDLYRGEVTRPMTQ